MHIWSSPYLDISLLLSNSVFLIFIYQSLTILVQLLSGRQLIKPLFPIKHGLVREPEKVMR